MAIGRNYSEHAKELNNAVPKEPIIFLKPTTSYVASGGNVEIPRGILAHYEGRYMFKLLPFALHSSENFTVELGVVIGKRGRDIPRSDAESYVAGYGTHIKWFSRSNVY